MRIQSSSDIFEGVLNIIFLLETYSAKSIRPPAKLGTHAYFDIPPGL